MNAENIDGFSNQQNYRNFVLTNCHWACVSVFVAFQSKFTELRENCRVFFCFYFGSFYVLDMFHGTFLYCLTNCHVFCYGVFFSVGIISHTSVLANRLHFLVLPFFSYLLISFHKGVTYAIYSNEHDIKCEKLRKYGIKKNPLSFEAFVIYGRMCVYIQEIIIIF